MRQVLSLAYPRVPYLSDTKSVLTLCSGYFEAPGTYMCPLQVRAPPATLPEVTLVFLSIEGMDAMKVGLIPQQTAQ